MSIKERIINRYRSGGVSQLFYKSFEVPLRASRDCLLNLYFRLVPGRTFMFQGGAYRYFSHTYNKTWKNERTIEIPIIQKLLKANAGKRILEVGNVLSHYFGVTYDVLDKYEKGRGVLNEDVVHFKSSTPYDLIVSISTMEHVGWDEEEKSGEKLIAGLENLCRNIDSHGMCVITMPLGYNSFLDMFLKDDRVPGALYFMKRVSADNKWEQTTYREVSGAKYDYPFPNANGLVICVMGRNIFN